MNLHRLGTNALAKEAAKALNLKLAETKANMKNKQTLLLISGGSALAILDFLDADLTDENTTISVFDDRHTTDPKQNNFCLLSETEFFKKSVARGARTIDTSLPSDSPASSSNTPTLSLQEHGQQFENNIKKWLKENPEGIVLATMGVGPDGHTGGMMPFPENPSLFQNLFESEQLAIGYDATGKNPFVERITVTMTFIKKYLSFAVVYMSGENKREGLGKILDEGGEQGASAPSLAEAPCRILREIPEVEIFTDIS